MATRLRHRPHHQAADWRVSVRGGPSWLDTRDSSVCRPAAPAQGLPRRPLFNPLRRRPGAAVGRVRQPRLAPTYLQNSFTPEQQHATGLDTSRAGAAQPLAARERIGRIAASSRWAGRTPTKAMSQRPRARQQRRAPCCRTWRSARSRRLKAVEGWAPAPSSCLDNARSRRCPAADHRCASRWSRQVDIAWPGRLLVPAGRRGLRPAWRSSRRLTQLDGADRSAPVPPPDSLLKVNCAAARIHTRTIQLREVAMRRPAARASVLPGRSARRRRSRPVDFTDRYAAEHHLRTVGSSTARSPHEKSFGMSA